MLYELRVTYTPDDRDRDRTRDELSFEADGTDKVEIVKAAIAAWQTAKGSDHNVERFIELFMPDYKDDLEDQNFEDGLGGFSFFAFGNHGEWFFDVDPARDG